jgi:hypothetical protein
MVERAHPPHRQPPAFHFTDAPQARGGYAIEAVVTFTYCEASGKGGKPGL